MSNKACSILVSGYLRTGDGVKSMPADITRLCTLFYSIWFDLKLVYCDDKTGAINFNKYEIKPMLIGSKLTLRDLAKQVIEITN